MEAWCSGKNGSDTKPAQKSDKYKEIQLFISLSLSRYLSQEDVLDRSNPFVQLVSGVVWLLRNGEVYINQSLKAECNKMVDQGKASGRHQIIKVNANLIK